MIHAIGDSHVRFFDFPPLMKYRYIGGYLAWSVGTPEHAIFHLLMESLKDIPVTDLVLLVFGEIDCRQHIIPQAKKQGRMVNDVVDEVVKRYCATIEKMTLTHQVKAFAPVPQGLGLFNVVFEPTLGPAIDRNNATRLFKDKLIEHLGKDRVWSLFDEMTDEKGITRPEFYVDDLHIGGPLAQKIFKQKFLSAQGVA